jgi:hypothetical protein
MSSYGERAESRVRGKSRGAASSARRFVQGQRCHGEQVGEVLQVGEDAHHSGSASLAAVMMFLFAKRKATRSVTCSTSRTLPGQV